MGVIWSSGGMSPDEMEKWIATISERAATTTVSGIEHMESHSMFGVSVIRVFFRPKDVRDIESGGTEWRYWVRAMGRPHALLC